MAQRQSRERFDPYEQYGAGNDEQWGGRGRRDEDRESWGGGRLRGEGWRGGERGGEYEPGRSYDANASRYRGGYGGQNEQWSDDYQSDWRRRNLDEDRYRGGGYGSGMQDYGRGGMGGQGRGESWGQGYGGSQQGWGRERDWAGGHGSENWNRGQQSGYGGGQSWNRSDSGGYGGQSYGSQSYGGHQGYGGSYQSGGRESSGRSGGYGAWQDPYGHMDQGARNPYAYGSGYGGGATDGSWDRGEESGMGGIRGSLGSAQRGGQGRQSFHGVGPQGYERSDEKLKEMICERLTEHHDIDPSQVQVEVSRGEVTLQGQVRDRETKYHIEDLVDKCGGVKEIHNNLRMQSQSGQTGLQGSQSGQPHGPQHAAQSGQTGQLGSGNPGAKSPDQSKQQR